MKEICDICNTSRQTWINFKNDFNCKTGFIVKRNLRKGDKNIDYYPEDILKTFQLWLRRNAINAGGQRTEGSIIKQEIHDIVDNSGYKYSKEDICSICNCSIRTFESFVPKELSERDFISVGSSHKKISTYLIVVSVGLIYIGYSNE